MKNPCDTLLCRPGADKFLADRILGTQAMPGGQLNDINPYYKLVSPLDWDYLEAAEAAFFIGKRQSEDFQFHERQMPQINFFKDNNNNGYKTSIDIRIGILIKNWRTWSRGGGTSA